MKIALQNIATCLMALMVLFSTMSFTVDMHYCGNELVDVALLKPAKDCGMDMQTGASSDDNTLNGSHCCSDEHLVVEGQKELKTPSFDKLSLHQQAILVSYVFSTLNLFEGLEENVVPFSDYTPPLIVSEIHLENETFLI